MDENVKSTGRSNVHFMRQAFVSAGVCFNIIGHGGVIGLSAVLIPSLRGPDSYIKATVSEESWIASIIGFALIVGNIIITIIMDALGRKKCHILSIIPILSGWFVLLLVRSVSGIILARFLQGISLGMLGPLGSVIIGETSEPRYRGGFLAFISMALTLGVLLTHTIGILFSWQIAVLVCSFISFTSLLLVIYSPESPSWLVAKGRYDESREIFVWLRGNGPEQDDELEKMIKAQMMQKKSSIAGQKVSFLVHIRRFFRYVGETYKKPEFYKPIIIMLHMYTMFQFAGINVFSSYMIDIIKQVVGPEANAKVWMVIFNVQRLISNIIAILLITKLRRRLVLFTAGGICVLSYLAKAAYVYAKQTDRLPFENQWVPIILLSVYMFSLAVGLSAIPFMVSGEIFPLAYRGLGGGISVLALSLNLFLAVKMFPVLNVSMGLPLTYLLYTGVVIYCLSVIWFLLPETKDKTLQEIEDSFKGKQRAIEDQESGEPLKESEINYGMGRRCSSQIIY